MGIKNVSVKLKTCCDKLKKRDGLCSALAILLSLLLLNGFVCLTLNTASQFHYVNLLYSLAWSIALTALFVLLPRRVGMILYCISYYLLLFYGVAQYFYHKIFNKLFSFTVFANINEGAGYADIIFNYIGIIQILLFTAMVLVPIFTANVILKTSCAKLRIRFISFGAALLIFIAAQFTLPNLLGESTDAAKWDSFNDLRYVYDNYTDPHKCLGAVGYFQYLTCDFYNCFLKDLYIDYEKLEAEIAQFFKDYPSTHEENEYTGIYEGKNVIIVMMESVDYLAINATDTPNIYKMMSDGIVFTRYYSSIYGDGATFANEFLLNTGLTAPASGTAAYAYINNTFSQSLPNLFKNAGYSANSFHKNYGWFYNRQLMHSTFGYDRYVSYYDFGGSETDVNIDTYLTDTPELMAQLFGSSDKPFMSFVITYSPHLPYTYDNIIYEYAAENFSRVTGAPYDDEDLYSYCTKVKITDAMLGALIEQADENTVFVCVSDHFAYGLDEDTLLQYKGSEWSLRQNTPFFIYCKDPNTPRLTVDKLCSNADFLPTIANLFGLTVPSDLIGHDIFDDSYKGFVIFSNYSWLSDSVYYHDGIVNVYGEYTDDEVGQMTSYMYRRMKVNEYLLTADHYSK